MNERYLAGYRMGKLHAELGFEFMCWSKGSYGNGYSDGYAEESARKSVDKPPSKG